MDRDELLYWLRLDDPVRLRGLWRRADHVRRRTVGDEVHLRAIVEFSSCCTRACHYCVLRAPNEDVRRYRMRPGEIVRCAVRARDLGIGTVLLQSGEGAVRSASELRRTIRTIREHLGLVVALGVGEASEQDLAAWRDAGAERYLLKFESSDEELMALLHPPRWPGEPDRTALIGVLQSLGYEVGSGNIVGLPGQSWSSVAQDLLRFRELDLDMIAIGPYVPHPATPLGRRPWTLVPDQVPGTARAARKVLALARILCPEANIPVTTALAGSDPRGLTGALRCGANVVMVNLTPDVYRRAYALYPDGFPVYQADPAAVVAAIRSLGRTPGRGPGPRRRSAHPVWPVPGSLERGLSPGRSAPAGSRSGSCPSCSAG